MFARSSVRTLHLGVGLLAAGTVLLYGVSSLVMAHADRFPREPVVETRHVTISRAFGTSPRAIVRWLVLNHGVRGELVSVDESVRTYRLTMLHPGVRSEIEYSRGLGDAVITTRTESTAWFLAALHEVRGVTHDSWLLNAWGVWFGIIAVALLALAGC